MSDIILSTINARYIHASLGLRYLHANMIDELKPRTQILEFTLAQRVDDIVEVIVNQQPSIVGFGVYIWNTIETTEAVRMLRLVAPNIKIIVGGPEISHEATSQELYKIADHTITGQADLAFSDACEQLLAGNTPPKLISALPFKLEELQYPYSLYNDEDLRNRVLYVEASRGCPFKCEFCLSSLDKTAVAFNLDTFLHQLEQLIDRGARHFKFVDRTFNLKIDTSKRILEFFLSKINGSPDDGEVRELFLHFELIPDRLPEAIKELLPRFPKGCLQFEIGIQSFNPNVQKLISRKQQHDKTCANLQWLRQHTHAHIHADLIFGLPSETLESFGSGFNQLYALGPQEIQVGILKRLRGTPLARHTDEYDMRYMNTPPYRILCNRHVDFACVQRMIRFARYWDLIGNSGRFPNTLPVLLGNTPFERFLQTSDWIFNETAQTHKIALPRLFTLIHKLLIQELNVDTEQATTILELDFQHNRLKGKPTFHHALQPKVLKQNAKAAQRQSRHIATIG